MSSSLEGCEIESQELSSSLEGCKHSRKSKHHHHSKAAASLRSASCGIGRPGIAPSERIGWHV
eukprot:2593350-Pleurochrysis_carterae.AAC.1